MSQLGTEANPLRVAIVGSGPTGFYAADHLFKQKNTVIEIDMFDRLPTPYGLVRFGVAPDHQKIKSVTKAFARTASNPRLRFYGNVELGNHVTVADLRQHYHQIIYTIGAQSDRKMSIPGEDLQGSHPATHFVAWYNGHPDYRDFQFDLSQEQVAVVGIGNVAMDVARILARTPEELAKTDIADYALEALRHSKVKEIYILGRRGPAQAKFTNPEIREMGELSDADIAVLPEEVEVDPLSQAALDASKDRAATKNIEILQGYVVRKETDKSRKVTMRFLVSPVELFGNEQGQVTAMRLVKNELYATDTGVLRPRATDQFEEIPVGLVFRSVGYRGIAVPGIPFNDSWGVILNQDGRVLNADSQEPVLGEYTAGWIKRGPSGVIGTNKPDALETVKLMMEDFANNQTLTPTESSVEAAADLIKGRQPHFFSFDEWLKLDELEVAKGSELGRPRLKFTSAEDMLAALGR